MEVKNGIIIDGVLHEAVQYKINCKRCSLLSVCHEFNAVCAVIGCEAFVERGKVTVTSYYRETPKNAGEIIKNRKGGITMGFTTPCFIRKNTPELRKKLEELGYNCSSLRRDRSCLFTAAYLNVYHSIHPEWLDNEDIRKTNDIDCGTNEELFLAIAALRDDTNYMQWFVCTSDYKEFDGKEWKVGDFDLNTCPDDFDDILPNWRKATVNELIQHFKEKEE